MSDFGVEALGVLCGVCAVVVGPPLVWAVVTYNRFARLGQQVKEGWSGVDVELRRRRRAQAAP